EKELMDQVASLKSSVEKLSRGEYIHKEILFNNARDYSKRGLGSFPELNQALLHLRRSRLASSRKLVHIANIAKSPGTTLGSAPYHHALFLIYQRITL